MRLALRPADPRDLPSVLAIERASFTMAWSEEAFSQLLSRSDAALWIAEEEGRQGIAGYAVAWWVGPEGELANFAVAPDRRGRGVGGELLDRVIERAAELGIRYLFLEVRRSNESALRLYQGRGFERVGIRKNYYSNPSEDADVLVRGDLGDSPLAARRNPSRP